MFSTPGLMLTAVAVLLCSQIILTTWIWWLARRVRHCLTLVSAATSAEQAPSKWESRLRELADEVVSLSSSYEKAQRLLTKLNSRAGMRELRSDLDASDEAPPVGTPKSELWKWYADRGRIPAGRARTGG